MKIIDKDIIIVGAGIAGLFTALSLPEDINIAILCKGGIEENDSYLAQGGICVQNGEDDFDSFVKDTLEAGHNENDIEAVKTMVRESVDVISDLINYGVEFDKDENGNLEYTREGGHSKKRILHFKDETGSEIIRKLLKKIYKKKNVVFYPWTMMTDLEIHDAKCFGVIANEVFGNNEVLFRAKHTVLATGGIGGLFRHSTNFRQLTGDAISIALSKGIETINLDYIQIHPTAFYEETDERRFLISEAMRGEGAILLNKDGKRFTDELLTRDKLTEKINEQIKKDGRDYVMLSAVNLGEKKIKEHFPNIYKYCLEKGYDITKEPIPVSPAQHYFMGGIKVDLDAKTSVENLFAVGETACTGVHGKNRLASNSLLEALVFAKRMTKVVS